MPRIWGTTSAVYCDPWFKNKLKKNKSENLNLGRCTPNPTVHNLDAPSQ